MRNGCRIFLLLLTGLGAHSALAQQADDVVITSHHINPVRDARTPWSELRNCLQDAACAAAVNAISAQVGIPANAMRLVSAGAAFTAKPEGEETRYAIAALAGRRICRVHVRTTSVVPAIGNRASLFSLTATRSDVALYTWTPRLGVGKGRSWYDGIVLVAHVPSEKADAYVASGKCSIPESPPAAYACRGSSGVNNRLAACQSKDL